MRTKRVLRAAVAFLFAFGVLAADLTPLRTICHNRNLW